MLMIVTANLNLDPGDIKFHSKSSHRGCSSLRFLQNYFALSF